MKKTTTKRGAPRKAPERMKNDVFQISLNPAEKQGFADAAALDGKKIAEWMRDRLRRDAREELEAAGRPVAFLAYRSD